MNHKQRQAARRRAAQIRRNAEALERTERMNLAAAFHRVQVSAALLLLQRFVEAMEQCAAVQQSASQTKH